MPYALPYIRIVTKINVDHTVCQAKLLVRLKHSQARALLTSLHQLQTPLLESKSALATKELKVLSRVCSGAIKALKKDLEKVDAQIQIAI